MRREVAGICASLPGEREILIAELPDLPTKGDVVDWLKERAPGWSGYGPITQTEPGEDYAEELLELVESCATPYQPAEDTDENSALANPDQAAATVYPDASLPALAQAGGMDKAEIEANYCNDLANARWLRAQSGDDLLHSPAHGWMVWDGTRWKPDWKEARRLAHEVGERVWQLLLDSGMPDGFAFERLLKHVRTMKLGKSLDAMLKEAACLDGIDATGVEFDADAWLLNCPNGTVDLRSGELLPHNRDHRLSKICPTPYDPDAQCPRFQQFLSEIFSGQQDLIDYVKWIMGYAITGSTEHQNFFILHGTGANGKSTLLGTLQDMLGPDYAQQIDSETLMHHQHAQHPTGIARLQGARLVACMETTTGKRLNESLIKQLSGGDKITARRMRENPFEFTPQLKLFIGTNSPPVISDYSDGMWRRIRLIPFGARFQGQQRDTRLPEILTQERSGILALAVQAAQAVLEGEPPLPECVRAATDEYRQDQDMLSQFIEECCDTGDTGALVAKADFYASYKNWRESATCEGERAVSRRMKDLGYKEHRTNTARHWLGIRLRPFSGYASSHAA